MQAICLPRRNRSCFWGSCSSRLTFFLSWNSGWSHSGLMQASRRATRNLGKECTLERNTKISDRPLDQPSPLLWYIELFPWWNENKNTPQFWIWSSTRKMMNVQGINQSEVIILWRSSLYWVECVWGWRSLQKSRSKDGVSVLLSTFSYGFPCASSHRDASHNIRVPRIKHSCIRCRSRSRKTSRNVSRLTMRIPYVRGRRLWSRLSIPPNSTGFWE